MTPSVQPAMPPAQAARKAAPPEPVDKGPVPAEHMVLQEVFDGLRAKCMSAANHPVRISTN